MYIHKHHSCTISVHECIVHTYTMCIKMYVCILHLWTFQQFDLLSTVLLLMYVCTSVSTRVYMIGKIRMLTCICLYICIDMYIHTCICIIKIKTKDLCVYMCIHLSTYAYVHTYLYHIGHVR